MNAASLTVRVLAILFCTLLLTFGSIVMEPATNATREGTEQC